ncbi:MAG TPA: SDR family oxidoreductase [Steroidobacteraceae bacterium]|nr:SDR family oxidoreductase [Steroidobacteraceae bacterium]
MSRITRRQFAAGAALAAGSLPFPAGMTAQPATDAGVIGLTGAAGRLGTQVVDALLRRVPPQRIVAIARNREEQTAGLAAKGVNVRFADYDYPEQLLEAFRGVDRLLLISSSGGKRVAQHGAVVNAARERGVRFVAYTSFLRAATSPMSVRADHHATEQLLASSGLAWAALRNGWYTENYEGDVATALRTGELSSASGAGRISPATRADYGAAAAAVLVDSSRPSGQLHELGGDTSFTMAELAAEIARQSGRSVVYRNLSEAPFRAAMAARGMPEAAIASSWASQAAIAQGALFDDSRQLSRLIGRPTTTWQQSVGEMVKAQRS